jgi:lysyl-tRNA synthetase class 2
MATIDDLKKTRLDKLEKLRKLGVDPYPALVRREHTIAAARTMDGRKVEVAGRVMGMRGHGKIFFWDIVDETGKIQAAIKADVCAPASFKLVELVDIGDFVAVQGNVTKTQAGELTVFTESFQIITKTIRPLPDQWHGLKDVEERYR